MLSANVVVTWQLKMLLFNDVVAVYVVKHCCYMQLYDRNVVKIDVVL